RLGLLAGAELLGFLGNLALTPLRVRILQGLLSLLSHLLGLAGGLRLTASQAFGTNRVGFLAGHLVGESFQCLARFLHCLSCFRVGRFGLGGLVSLPCGGNRFVVSLRRLWCRERLCFLRDLLLFLPQFVLFLRRRLHLGCLGDELLLLAA